MFYKLFSDFFSRIRIMTRNRNSPWNSLTEVMLYIRTKDTHQISCRSAKFLWKLEFYSGSGSWFHFGFLYQTYISYQEDTHLILFGSGNSFESYSVYRQNPRTYISTYGQNLKLELWRERANSDEIYAWLSLQGEIFFC